MYHYHQNIHDYNENMRRFLYILEDERQRINTTNRREYSYFNTVPRTNTTMPILNTFVRRYLNNRDNTNILRYNYENVVIRPNARQIEQATETVICNESHTIHNNCPITLEPFIIGEEISRIRHCSHTFKKTALMNWFSRNVRCPVCRYDIREYTGINEPLTNYPNVQDNIESDDNNNEDTDNNDLNDSSEFDDIIQELNDEVLERNNRTTSNTRSRTSNPLLSSLTSVIRSFVENEIQHLPSHINNAAELLYTFDIPITFDVSGNDY